MRAEEVHRNAIRYPSPEAAKAARLAYRREWMRNRREEQKKRGPKGPWKYKTPEARRLARLASARKCRLKAAQLKRKNALKRARYLESVGGKLTKPRRMRRSNRAK
jgi:hypothetical protein